MEPSHSTSRKVPVGSKIWWKNTMRKADEYQWKMVICCCWHSLANRRLVHYFCEHARWRISCWAHCVKCQRTLKGTLQNPAMCKWKFYYQCHPIVNMTTNRGKYILFCLAVLLIFMSFLIYLTDYYRLMENLTPSTHWAGDLLCWALSKVNIGKNELSAANIDFDNLIKF